MLGLQARAAEAGGPEKGRVGDRLGCRAVYLRDTQLSRSLEEGGMPVQIPSRVSAPVL